MEHGLGGDRAVIIVSALVAILSSSSSVSKDNSVPLQRQLVLLCTRIMLQLLKGEMSWKEKSSLIRLWLYQWMKHTVSPNGDFIARHC